MYFCFFCLERFYMVNILVSIEMFLKWLVNVKQKKSFIILSVCSKAI